MPIALVSPQLAVLVGQCSDEARHDMVQRACLLAVKRTNLDDDATILEALEAIDRRQFGNPSLTIRLDALTEELDEIAWDLQDQAAAGKATMDEYGRAFTKARAVAALGYALDGSPKSSLEALYEAYHAVDAEDEFVRSVAG